MLHLVYLCLQIEAQSDGNNTVFESVMARWKVRAHLATDCAALCAPATQSTVQGRECMLLLANCLKTWRWHPQAASCMQH